MSKQEAFMTLEPLTQKLQEMARRLGQGQLKAEEITEMTALARELYERMIILEFKAFEDELGVKDLPPKTGLSDGDILSEEVINQAAKATASSDAPRPNPDADANKREESPSPTSVEEPEIRPAFRFSPKAPVISTKDYATEVSPNQISLIDSIEELTQEERSINDKFKDTEAKTLAQKLKLKPIDDLKTAIGINMRFQFTSTLFENDAEAYQAAIEKLNNFQSFLEADEYIQNQLKTRFGWQMRSQTVKEFMSLVERRYL